jgi:lipoteichoic acid synthase
MEEKDMSIDIPLYIVNGNINAGNGWQGRCNQLDVYTTLLDLLGSKNEWRGFGHTLVTDDYYDSVKSELWKMSEDMVLGNYFKM